MSHRLTLVFWILAAAALGYWFFFASGIFTDERKEIDYSTFKKHLQAGRVESVSVEGDRIEGSLKGPYSKGSAEANARKNGKGSANEDAQNKEEDSYKEFWTILPSFGDDELLSLLEKNEVRLHTEQERERSWFRTIISLLPMVLLIALGVLFFRKMRQQGGQMMSMRKSRAKQFQKRGEDTRFTDVAGAQGPKAELKDIIEFLIHPEKFRRLGGTPPRGVLLVGPPGTGKTLLARAVAGEAEVPFLSITGSDFMEMFVGVGASRVRDLFKEARKSEPSIVFIDELDSIGRRRGAGLGGGHDEREQTLNQLLSELDGFDPRDNVVVLAASNRPDILDPALLRPGRFGRRVVVDLPQREAREEILKVHSRKKPLEEDVNLAELARATPGFSGADLANLLNEAALLAARDDKESITADDVETARDKVLLGLEKEGVVLTREECRLLAFHEAGHAVVASVTPTSDPLHKVTIVPRGKAMGVTQQLPKKDRYLYTRPILEDRLAVMLGGRASEKLAMDTASTGAENDLKEATKLARKMVLEWGMSPTLGPMAFGQKGDKVFLGEEIAENREYSEETAQKIDDEVNRLLQESMDKAMNILQNHREGLQAVAEALQKDEILSGETVEEILDSHR